MCKNLLYELSVVIVIFIQYRWWNHNIFPTNFLIFNRLFVMYKTNIATYCCHVYNKYLESVPFERENKHLVLFKYYCICDFEKIRYIYIIEINIRPLACKNLNEMGWTLGLIYPYIHILEMSFNWSIYHFQSKRYTIKYNHIFIWFYQTNHLKCART